MPLNHPVRMTDSQADWLAEDMAGASLVPAPTPEEDAALSLELARENAEGFIELDEVDLGEDGPECEFCGFAVPDGQSAYAPYCSMECEQEAGHVDAEADARHQAAKDRAREPDRWKPLRDDER